MESIILFALASIGFTAIMVESIILQSFREFLKARIHHNIYKVFECFQCMGFWTGLACGYVLISQNPPVVLMCGFTGSFLSTLSATYLNYLDARSIVDMGDNDIELSKLSKSIQELRDGLESGKKNDQS